jgi:hypothetical protein
MSTIRKFNSQGVSAFENLLDEFRAEKKIDAKKLNSLLVDPTFSSEIESGLKLPEKLGTKKYEIARAISVVLKLNQNPKLYYDKGLWTWLGASLLEILAPIRRGSSERDFREKALYVLESENWTKYYRHLLSFPCWVFAELGDKGKIFLRGEIHERGEIVEQLASVHEIQRNKSIVEAATLLFYNKKADDIYKGAASKNQPGTARRFRDVVQQFKLTFDLNAMDGTQIVGILPEEFKRWHRAS